MQFTILILALVSSLALAAEEAEPSRAEIERTTKNYEFLRREMERQVVEKNERAAAIAERFERTHVWTGNSKKARQNRAWRAAIEKQAKKSADEAERAERAYQVFKQKHEEGLAKIEQLKQAEAKIAQEKAQARDQAESEALAAAEARTKAARTALEEGDKAAVAGQVETQREYGASMDNYKTVMEETKRLLQANREALDQVEEWNNEIAGQIKKFERSQP